MTDHGLALQRRGALFGLAAAATFGVSAPLAKLLLGTIPPTLLAGLLYLGAAIALSLYPLLRRESPEARFGRADVPRLLAVAVSGGIVAPVLMLLGLRRMTAFAGSLLLNLEAPFTILLAVTLFREHLGLRAAAASAFILAGALVLNVDSASFGGTVTGALLIAAACFAWAIDNNLSQGLSLRDPLVLVRTKALVAGVVNTTLGSLLGGDVRTIPIPALVGALALGAMSYGISVVLDAYALRYIGAAREAAYFATAPFVGAVVALAVFHEPLVAFDVLAMVSMAIGVAILVGERHAHRHVHEPLEHEHRHVHDEHHQHEHAPGDPPGEPHSHFHRHERLEHEHVHVSDAHHRHEHDR